MKNNRGEKLSAVLDDVFSIAGVQSHKTDSKSAFTKNAAEVLHPASQGQNRQER